MSSQSLLADKHSAGNNNKSISMWIVFNMIFTLLAVIGYNPKAAFIRAISCFNASFSAFRVSFFSSNIWTALTKTGINALYFNPLVCSSLSSVRTASGSTSSTSWAINPNCVPSMPSSCGSIQLKVTGRSSFIICRASIVRPLIFFLWRRSESEPAAPVAYAVPLTCNL